MAVTLWSPISAGFRQVLAFLRSVFILLFGVLRRASQTMLHLFSPPPSTSQPTTPSSTTKARHEQTEQLQAGDTAASAPRSTAGDSSNLNGHLQADEASPDNAEMSASSSSSSAAMQPPLPKKVPVPQIIPALPRLPLPLKKENTAPKSVATTSAAITSAATFGTSTAISDVTQLANGVTRLRLDAGLATTTTPSPTSPTSQSPVEDVAAQAGNNGQTPVVTRGPIKDASDPDRPGLLSDPLANREVFRYPAVPMSHEVSQSSKLKETAATTAGEKAVQTQVNTLPETPEQAAERALHSGFMREALDMVCTFLALLLSPFVSNGHMCLRSSHLMHDAREQRFHRAQSPSSETVSQTLCPQHVKSFAALPPLRLSAPTLRLPLIPSPIVTLKTADTMILRHGLR